MCLAKVYVSAAADEDGPRLLMENVTRVVVEGEKVLVTSLFSETDELHARIASVDFAEARLMLQSGEL